MPSAQGGPRIFIVAGEESGDRLGAALMAAIRDRAATASFRGVGGSAMTQQGLSPLFAVDEIAITGIAAILADLPRLWRRINQAAAAVVAERPDVLVIIDSPEFTHRVARRVRAAAPGIPIIDYVSPTVWAWRPGRASAMRRYVDEIMALLPFEPEVHRRLGGPPCTFVGHPLAEQTGLFRTTPADQARRHSGRPLILALPGSRGSEVRRLLSTFGEALGLALKERPEAELVLPTVDHLFEYVSRETRNWPIVPRIVVTPEEKWASFRQARAALAASGTVTLELALAQVPTVLAYKLVFWEAAVARLLVKTPMVGLANIILGEKVMPELLLRDATARQLSDALAPLLQDTPQRRAQMEAFETLATLMAVGDESPSSRAAGVVLRHARRDANHQ